MFVLFERSCCYVTSIPSSYLVIVWRLEVKGLECMMCMDYSRTDQAIELQ